MLMFLNPGICIFMSLILSFMQDALIPRIVTILCALIFASLCYVLKQRRVVLFLTFIYLLLCCVYEDFFCYLPVVIYMVLQSNEFHMREFVFLVPVLFHLWDDTIYIPLLTMAASLLAMGLKIQYLKSENLKKAYQKQRDATQELALVLSVKNHDLMVQQEQEIRIATLDERNRIAREIHDNVGHLLSSSLLQIGALQFIEKDENCKESLSSLRETISSAMDSVRKSVHDLHAEAVDMKTMIDKLIANFTFCDVNFEYDIIHPFHQKVVYHIAAIIKECLNNTMKHSNATNVNILLREQPAFYQIILRDNGTEGVIRENGIGLRNIYERIENLQGYVNITVDDGFQIFITLPKEAHICEC